MLKNEVTATRGPIVTGGRPFLHLAVTPKHPDRICTNASSVTFEAHAGAKWKQDGPAYGTTAWQKIYGRGSQIEAANAHFKDQAHEGGDNAGRRRKRGLAAQAVVVTLLLVSSNMRRIKAFLTRDVETPEPATPVWRRSALSPSAQVERIQQSREGPPLDASADNKKSAPRSLWKPVLSCLIRFRKPGEPTSQNRFGGGLAKLPDLG